ncbi:uroporphyrinogen-III C-methyltransferase [Seongchinamella unica]|uniref:Siroheme synthase n=1 Tax=Seongchinamella unica TaxID=2547392 RepID=A0A4R5LSH7_9GAMM|nr:siroheme synthase CysG [Seongchinamella unica]TDG13868.1 uroporphyrinogen-III C-methyltransferase [Seongchinamella unica]
MQYLPVCLQVRNSPVVLVGGGTVATRKARLLLRAGANLNVVAPQITPELQLLLAEHGGNWQQSRYRESDLHGRMLVVAATPDREVNKQVHADAMALNLPVNVVDSPDLCTFIFPSIVDRDPLLIAISSSGRSPVLARQLRRKIEAMVPAAYGRLASFAGRFRDRVKDAIPEETPRRLFWEQVMEGAVAEQVMGGREARAEELLETLLADTSGHHNGEVYLIGAGPGDPDLMTFKAVRLLQSADVVLYDRLVSAGILEMSRRDAERIYVGKRRDDHAVPQGEINQLLVDLAKAGKRVVRLKGGDPFIFGRGGEEIELLARHRVPFQVVPGITAASGAACYSGIPLTHRDHAQSVRFVTGHLKDGSSNLDWASFQSETETLVFYMGLVGLPIICEQLQAYGRRADTPMALIERATSSEQRVITGTLATMVDRVEREKPRAPTLIIVGSVVELHEQLSWFGKE